MFRFSIIDKSLNVLIIAYCVDHSLNIGLG